MTIVKRIRVLLALGAVDFLVCRPGAHASARLRARRQDRGFLHRAEWGGPGSRRARVGRVVARRAWFASRYLLMTTMAWELCFIPDQSTDIWVHHCAVIGYVLATAECSIGNHDRPVAQRALINGAAAWIIYGTAMVFGKEGAVLFYHLVGPKRIAAQVRMLRVAVWAHVTNQLLFYLALPVALLADGARQARPIDERIPTSVEVILSLGLVFLNVLESYIGYVTVVVFRKKKKKLAALKEQIQMRECEVSERTMA